MIVFLNKESAEIEAGSTLESLLKSKGLDAIKGAAVAVNENVAPRKQWAEIKLMENDKILIISATRGG
jgi:sulfur carrier protein